jgi:hypothetical protein
VDDENGAKLMLSDAADLSGDLTVGRVYKLTLYAAVDTGDEVDIQVYDGDSAGTVATVDADTMTFYEYWFTAQHATNGYIQMAGMAADEIIYLDAIELKEFVDLGNDLGGGVLRWKFGGKAFEPVAAVGDAVIDIINDDKDFSPHNAGAAYYDATYLSKFVPRREIRITATYTGGSETEMWRGFLERMDVDAGTYGRRHVRVYAKDNMELCNRARVGNLALQTSAGSDAVLEAVLDNVTVGGNPRFDYAGITTGDETFVYGADTWFQESTTVRKALVDITNSEGWPARFWFGADGQPVFKARNWAQSITDTPNAIAADDVANGMSYSWAGEKFANIVHIKLTPRVEGSAGTTIYTHRAEPPLIHSGDSITIRCPFVDATSGRRIGASAVTTPVATTDFTANTQSDGTGDSYTGTISVSMTTNAESANVTFSNDGYQRLYIRGPSTDHFRVRGTPLKAFEPSERTASDSTSAAEFGDKDITINAPLQNDSDHAYDFADYLLSQLKDPQASVTLSLVNGDSTNEQTIVDLGVGDVVALSETQTGLSSAEYLITGETHEVTMTGALHKVTWNLEPRPDFDGWLLGVTGRSELGVSTYLGV